MAIITKTIHTPSFMAAVYEVAELVKEGYEVSTTEAPYQGLQCIVQMEKEVREILKAKTK